MSPSRRGLNGRRRRPRRSRPPVVSERRRPRSPRERSSSRTPPSAAAIACRSGSVKPAIPMGIVHFSELLRMISGHRKLFQLPRKAKIASTDRAGRTSGTMTLIEDAPGGRSVEPGGLLQFRRDLEHELPEQERSEAPNRPGRISAIQVSASPAWSKPRNSGTTATSLGSVSVMTNSRKTRAPAGEPQPRERERREGRDDQGEHRRDGGYDQAVQEQAPEVDLGPRVHEVGPEHLRADEADLRRRTPRSPASAP